MPQARSKYTCLAVILNDFVFKKDENYYLQLFLKNANTMKKKKGDKMYY